MPNPHSPTLRSLYRRLLRELPARTTQPQTASRSQSKQTILSHPSHIQQRIRTSFVTAPESKHDDVLPKIHEVEQFVQYVKAQRMYLTLVERYNPGMKMTEEERVRLTARRVGMDLPVEVHADALGKK